MKAAAPAIEIPKSFLRVRYNGAKYPGAPGDQGLRAGANCQRFAYALLRHFGREVPSLRSSDLWDDTRFTIVARRLRPLDLLLFSRDGRSRGAHVGVYLGAGRAIHLAKKLGKPAIWTMAEFAADPAYETLVGAKRVKTILVRKNQCAERLAPRTSATEIAPSGDERCRLRRKRRPPAGSRSSGKSLLP